MLIAATPTQSDIFTALRGFLLDILPTGVEIVQGQTNRVAPPAASDYVVMWPLMTERLATNLPLWYDAVFTGQIASTTLTITAVDPRFTKTIDVGSVILGVGVASNTVVTQRLTGSGGIGTYRVTPSQTLTSRTLAAGQEIIEHPTEVVIQIDAHGPTSFDNVARILTLLRDERATMKFAEYSDLIVPLYASDPHQAPFVNAEQQIENRWVIEAHLQVTYVYTLPQEFADEIETDLLSVEPTYPS